MTPLKQLKYVQMKLSNIPDEVVVHYGLTELATPDVAIFLAVKKGMYGLPQDRLLTQELLAERLGKKDISKATSPLGCGSTKSVPSHSPYVWMILE